jgi:hypothetical protein
MKFSVSPPLGRLAKWLRILGYDCRYPVVSENDVDTSGRIHIVRRSGFRGRPVVFLDQNRLHDQLRLLNLLLPIYENRSSFTRCVDCNSPLETVGRDEVVDRVPDYVSTICTHFTRCPVCNRILWPGTHRDNMESSIESIFSAS